jgi:hypothetical protein
MEDWRTGNPRTMTANPHIFIIRIAIPSTGRNCNTNNGKNIREKISSERMTRL